MARGFWTGLLHGGVLSAAALAALAILVPVSPPLDGGTGSGGLAAENGNGGEAVTPDTAPDAEVVAGSDPAPDPVSSDPGSAPALQSTATQQEPGGGPAPSDRPEAPSVDLPVGSEFARGGDIAPQLPAPLSTPPDHAGQVDAPAVSAPAAEPAPVAFAADDPRPDTSDIGSTRADPQAPDMVEDVGVTRPGTLGLPEQPLLPGFSGAGNPDSLPARTGTEASPPAESQPPVPPAPDLPASELADDPDSPAPEAVAGQQVAAQDNPGGEFVRPGQAGTTRAIPAPGPDLSLPPGLSDLTSLRRN